MCGRGRNAADEHFQQPAREGTANGRDREVSEHLAVVQELYAANTEEVGKKESDHDLSVQGDNH